MSKTEFINSPWPEWKIEDILGQGSFATVYKAVRIEGESCYYAAIKHIPIPASQEEINAVINQGFASDADSLNRYFEDVAHTFINEIKAMYQLRGNTNIVLYEDHRMQKKEDNIGWDIFIRMELLQPLPDLLRNRTLDRNEIARLGADICTAISLCCAKGIIHRDIKPSNIYISESGSFKLGDFGSSILYRDNNHKSVLSGTTPAYLAPELYSGSQAFCELTDVYALGLVLYRLLNNDRLPFVSADANNSDETIMQAIDRRNNGERIPPPIYGDPALNQVILKAIEYQPSTRYASAEEFKKALINYINAHSTAPTSSPLEATQRADVPSYGHYPPSYGAPYEHPAINNPSNANLPIYSGYQNYSPNTGNQSPASPRGNQTSDKSKTLHLIIICATICVLAAIVGIIVMRNQDTPTGTAKDTSSEWVSVSGGNDSMESQEPQDNSVETTSFEPNPYNVIPVKSTSCSRHEGSGKYSRKYTSDMAVDGKPETCWMANGSTAGKGNWIRLDFEQKTTITGIKIINGNTWDGVYNGQFISGYDHLYEKNGRLHEFSAELSDGTVFSGSAEDVKETAFGANIFYFNSPVETTCVKIYVVSGYSGYKYKTNICIGEIQAFC